MSDGVTRIRIVRTADDAPFDPHPGAEAPEGRELLIYAPRTLGEIWYRAIKIKVRGYSKPRWKVFGVDGRRGGAYLFREFVPDLFTEVPDDAALVQTQQ